METITRTTYSIFRPGGFIITDRALTTCRFEDGAKILDLGCGSGATVEHIMRNYGFETYGIDLNPELFATQKNLVIASANEIPISASSVDGVMMECSLSVMGNQEAVLKECYRVLKDRGWLMISDMYARGEPVNLKKGCLGKIDTKEALISLIENMGFKTELFEDFSPHLQTFWGQMIFDKGAKTFYCDMGVDPEVMKRIKCGYCLIVAQKTNQNQ